MLDKLKAIVRSHLGLTVRNQERLLLANAEEERLKSDALMLKNKTCEIAKLSRFQKEVFEKLNLDRSVAHQLRLAVEEIVVNVINYAYPEGKEGEIEVRMMSDGNRMKVQIIDSGVPFDPTAKEIADTSLSAEERQIGGLGILLARELVDTIHYERVDGRNILTLIKNINS